MSELFQKAGSGEQDNAQALSALLREMSVPFSPGDRVGIKLHWGERGNRTHLPPAYAKGIARWLLDQGMKPFVFDTTVLYTGGRRTAKDSLETAARHGYTPGYLGCEVVVSDGPDGRSVVDLPCSYRHFKSVQVGDVFCRAEGYVIFSHFKAHLASGFGGAIKNLSMGFGSRAQKQRMHADAKPVLSRKKCSRCGVCAELCPTGAARIGEDEEGYPVYDLKQCIGCAQCIGMCPEAALRISFNSDMQVFQEKLVETAAAVWKRIEGKSVLVNALLNIASECDCMPGKLDYIAGDIGFLGGYEPVGLDLESIRHVGEGVIDATHRGVPWRRQFSYAREIGFPGA
jgi:uncharacterized protein